MGFWTKAKEFFSPVVTTTRTFKGHSCWCDGTIEAFAYKAYAIEIAINRIANSIALANFETYEQKKIVQKDNWWLLNIEPNPNQNKAAFWQDVLHQMVYGEDGALIVQSEEGWLIVADSFSMKRNAYYPNTYSDITLPENFHLSVGRKEPDVLRLELNNNRVKSIIDGVYLDYGRLIGGSIRNYNRGNAMKVVVKIGALFDQYKTRTNEDGENEFDFIIDDIMKNRMRGLLSDGDSATPLEDGLELQPIETSANTKSGAVTTRDITATFEDIVNMVADAFHIPRGLMKGDVADVEAMTENYINLCVRPIAEQIESEFNRKMYSRDMVLGGTRLRVDTSTIMTRDPVKFAASAEAIFRIGGYSTNDIRRKMGEEPIAEDWADEYYVTKNYERINGDAEKED